MEVVVSGSTPVVVGINKSFNSLVRNVIEREKFTNTFNEKGTDCFLGNVV